MAKKKLFAPPDQAEREYVRAAKLMTRMMEHDTDRIIIAGLPALVAQHERDMRGDDAIDELERLMMAFTIATTESVDKLVAKLPFIAGLIDKHNASEFSKVFKSNTGYDLPPAATGYKTGQKFAIGVDLLRSEPFLVPMTEQWIKTNTDLIKTIPTRYNPEIKGIIQRGLTNGASVRDIKDDIKSRYAVNEHRAKLIAQDQTLKFHANLTQQRLESVGVTHYIWRSVQDSRVRPEHVEHNGKEYSWEKPPSDGNPGQPVRCRCRAEAVWDDE